MKRIIALYILLFLSSALMAQVAAIKIDDSKLNKPVMATLEAIYKNDQTNRQKLQELSKSGANTDELWNTIRNTDDENIVKVTQILDKYGWLGVPDVGVTGSQALFLVIQKADLDTQEKYLPLIENSVKEGKTSPVDLAIMKDKMAMRNGENQIYGSQVVNNRASGKIYIYPVIDPDHLDERRKAMGLQPMIEYCKNYNIKWDLEAYKKAQEEDPDSL